MRGWAQKIGNRSAKADSISIERFPSGWETAGRFVSAKPHHREWYSRTSGTVFLYSLNSRPTQDLEEGNRGGVPFIQDRLRPTCTGVARPHNPAVDPRSR